MTPRELVQHAAGPGAVPLRWLLALLTTVVVLLVASWANDVNQQLSAQSSRSLLTSELLAEVRTQRAEDRKVLDRLEAKVDRLLDDDRRTTARRPQ